jgi:hypothetical protein
MKLRYQLMLALFFLAVLPLAAITLYSYRASTQAVRRAVAAESGRMAEEMENRVASVTADLSRRLDQLQVIPAMPPPKPGAGAESDADEDDPGSVYLSRLISTLGSAADYLDSVEIRPLDEGPEPDDEADAGDEVDPREKSWSENGTSPPRARRRRRRSRKISPR